MKQIALKIAFLCFFFICHSVFTLVFAHCFHFQLVMTHFKWFSFCHSGVRKAEALVCLYLWCTGNNYMHFVAHWYNLISIWFYLNSTVLWSTGWRNCVCVIACIMCTLPASCAHWLTDCNSWIEAVGGLGGSDGSGPPASGARNAQFDNNKSCQLLKLGFHK